MPDRWHYPLVEEEGRNRRLAGSKAQLFDTNTFTGCPDFQVPQERTKQSIHGPSPLAKPKKCEDRPLTGIGRHRSERPPASVHHKLNHTNSSRMFNLQAENSSSLIPVEGRRMQ